MIESKASTVQRSRLPWSHGNPCEIEKVTSAEAGNVINVICVTYCVNYYIVVSLSVRSQLRQKSPTLNPNGGIIIATWLEGEIELSTIFGRIG